MSDHIPLESQLEILKLIPVRSLLRFACASRKIKSAITSPQFLYQHTVLRHKRTHRMLIRNYSPIHGDTHFVSYIDDDEFPNEKSVYQIPRELQPMYDKVIKGDAFGVICYRQRNRRRDVNRLFLYNPNISVVVPVDLPRFVKHCTFGVSATTLDPKLLTNTSYGDMTYGARLFDVKTKVGKNIKMDLPYPPDRVRWDNSLITDSISYWTVSEEKQILAFDFTTETFRTIDFPFDYVSEDGVYVYLCKMRGSVTIIHKSAHSEKAWRMEDNTRDKFTFVYDIHIPHASSVGWLGFPRRGGRIILDRNRETQLEYEPIQGENDVLESGTGGFNVCSYSETLLLLKLT